MAFGLLGIVIIAFLALVVVFAVAFAQNRKGGM